MNRSSVFGSRVFLYLSVFIFVFLIGTQTAAASGECQGDMDGDGEVSVEDLLAVIGAWGPCGDPCPQDKDGDGAVTVNELLFVLVDWGRECDPVTCPVDPPDPVLQPLEPSETCPAEGCDVCPDEICEGECDELTCIPFEPADCTVCDSLEGQIMKKEDIIQEITIELAYLQLDRGLLDNIISNIDQEIGEMQAAADAVYAQTQQTLFLNALTLSTDTVLGARSFGTANNIRKTITNQCKKLGSCNNSYIRKRIINKLVDDLKEPVKDVVVSDGLSVVAQVKARSGQAQEPPVVGGNPELPAGWYDFVPVVSGLTECYRAINKDDAYAALQGAVGALQAIRAGVIAGRVAIDELIAQKNQEKGAAQGAIQVYQDQLAEHEADGDCASCNDCDACTWDVWNCESQSCVNEEIECFCGSGPPCGPGTCEAIESDPLMNAFSCEPASTEHICACGIGLPPDDECTITPPGGGDPGPGPGPGGPQ